MNWIENYGGTWEDPTGCVLVIKVQDEYRAKVTLLVNGVPMARPWCRNKPAVSLRARYSPENGPGLWVSLGRRGFSLELNYEFLQAGDAPDEPASLSVGVSRHFSDLEAERFISLFSPLARYVRRSAEHVVSV